MGISAKLMGFAFAMLTSTAGNPYARVTREGRSLGPPPSSVVSEIVSETASRSCRFHANPKRDILG